MDNKKTPAFVRAAADYAVLRPAKQGISFTSRRSSAVYLLSAKGISLKVGGWFLYIIFYLRHW